jgi:predicted N-acyltransferase
MPRGFEPTVTASAHHLRDTRFNAAIRDYLIRERAAIAEELGRGEPG